MKQIDYHLKGVDKSVWQAAQSKAKANGHTMKFVIVALLRDYAANKQVQQTR